MKNPLKQLKTSRAQGKKGLSSVITTIMLTGVLLGVLIVATFVATGILNAQIVSTGFEQAKSNMLLLDSTIQDVSLRPGAGGFVQFSDSNGGIGIYEDPGTLTITASNGAATYSKTFSDLYMLQYSGGNLATSVSQTLKGVPDTNVSLNQGLGYLREQPDDGAKIKLDYNRARINPTGLINANTNLTQVSFIHLLKGNTGGSGPMNAMAQNKQTLTTTWQFTSTAPLSITVTYSSPTHTITGTYTDHSPPANSVVIFSEIQVEISIT
jgi:hypothetical protein